jgi:hypothetical protein
VLNPELVVNTVATALQSIESLVAALNNDPTRVVPFVFEGGDDVPLAKKIYEIPTPGILVVWKASQGGPFNGTIWWKHQIDLYIKSGNVANSSTPTGPGNLWWLIINGTLGNAFEPGNIRSVQLIPGELDLVNPLPSIVHHQDQDGLDYFVANFIFPEYGDN